jgi:hypothetical protein
MYIIMQSYFVHVDNPESGVDCYCRTFNVKLCDLYKEILSDKNVRMKLLNDLYGADRSSVESKYQNNEPDTVWNLLVELQRRLETATAGYFMCQLGALNGGVSF